MAGSGKKISLVEDKKTYDWVIAAVGIPLILLLITFISYAGRHTGQCTDDKFVYSYLIVLIALSAYYTIIWRRSGKDPERLSIYPVYTPPLDLSPSALRYILNMGYDNKVFASALTSLAVRGYLEVRKEKGSVVLLATEKMQMLATADLREEERSLLQNLMGETGRIELSFIVGRKNDTVLNALYEHEKSFENTYKKEYFTSNTLHVVIGGVFIFISVLVYCIAKMIAKSQLLWFIAGFYVWMIPFLIFSVIFAQKCVRAMQKKDLRHLCNAVTFPVGMYLLLLIFARDSIPSMVVIQLMVTVTIIFKYLLRAPTEAGRELRNRIEGFKMFLRATGKDRLNMMHPPDKTPELVDRYLPYALALDAGHEWSEKFEEEISWAWDIQEYCMKTAPSKD